MAFISEIHYRTGEVNAGDPSTYEFTEITLAPGEDPADFIVSFYDSNGNLKDNADDNIQATGVVDGQVRLSDLTPVPDPDVPGYMIYTITSTATNGQLFAGGTFIAAENANVVALTNTTTGTPIDAIQVSGAATTLVEGPAAGLTALVAGRVDAGESIQFDVFGNNISGPRTPGDVTVTCFCAGTRVEVPGGTCAVEDLKVGDLVVTRDRDAQPIRWIGRRVVSREQLVANPKLKPICVGAGSLGPGLPNKNLWVSRQHRFLTSSKLTKRMFGTPAAFVSAIKLTALPGIEVDDSVLSVMYYHLLFDQHEVIYAEGAPTESLYLGKEAICALSRPGRAEVATLFPDLFDGSVSPPKAAAPLLENRAQKSLVAQHAARDIPLLEAACNA